MTYPLVTHRAPDVIGPGGYVIGIVGHSGHKIPKPYILTKVDWEKKDNYIAGVMKRPANLIWAEAELQDAEASRLDYLLLQRQKRVTGIINENEGVQAKEIHGKYTPSESAQYDPSVETHSGKYWNDLVG